MKNINMNVKTQDFDGPLDLLITLIENKKISISSVNISDIIDDYLNLIEYEKTQNLKIKVEFLIMASELVEIKAYSILSEEKKEKKEKDLENRILEYKVVKELAEEFSKREVEFNIPHKITGTKVKEQSNISYSIEELNLNMLQEIMQEIISKNTRKENKIKIVVNDTFNTEEALFEIEKEFKNNNNNFSFSSLLKGNFSKLRIVCFFLAVLDLFKSGDINIELSDNDFYIRKEEND